jgi:hypothetical protein
MVKKGVRTVIWACDPIQQEGRHFIAGVCSLIGSRRYER